MLILLENLEIIKVVSGSVILPERLHFWAEGFEEVVRLWFWVLVLVEKWSTKVLRSLRGESGVFRWFRIEREVSSRWSVLFFGSIHQWRWSEGSEKSETWRRKSWKLLSRASLRVRVLCRQRDKGQGYDKVEFVGFVSLNLEAQESSSWAYVLSWVWWAKANLEAFSFYKLERIIVKLL